MSGAQFDAISRVMDSQLAEFRARRAVAERSYEKQRREFGEVVRSRVVHESDDPTLSVAEPDQSRFLRSASEPLPGDRSSGILNPAGSSVDYRGSAWLRRASD